MTPIPQELPNDTEKKPRTIEGDEVVISGMSGLYPQSDSVKDLSFILYNKINPVTDVNLRWKFQHPEMVQFTGKVSNLDRFDAQFFKVHFRLGKSMDAMARKILEQSYQAIYDAGLGPENLSGKKVGVYVGTCFSESEKTFFYDLNSIDGFGMAGCSKTMFANRISYWLNVKGPSMSIDEACCSSIAALEQAYLAISRGECEAAIVGGSNICLHPQSTIHYSRIMQICKDGRTKSFDDHADGCARSEAINVLFLQKAKDALRIYAEVVNVKSEYISIVKEKTIPKYGFYRDPMTTTNFLKTFYSKTRISPSDVEYVEAFGSAVPEADKSELEAIDNVFCKNRDNPILVGTVMSNIGYGEAASGISAITKVLLGYETGMLAGNLHLTTPRQDVSAIRDGRIEVIKDHCSFRRTYVGINALSITGVNAHVLLHGHYKPKDTKRYKSNIPRLVTISGRQESAVKKIIDDLKSRPIDPEELALLYNIHEAKISGHMGRGFIILDTKDDKTVSLTEHIEYFDEAKRPLWFVYSGMGSQWPGMGEQLMRIPIFAAAIERCCQILKPMGVDLPKVIQSRDKSIFDNVLHSFVGIAAVQIGLTDILRALGLVPDKIIGHSVGELGCAYADGCLTAEEMILAAYYRGLVSIETPLIRGSMAAVGLGFQQIKRLCPPEIEIACHNGPKSCTISGPEKQMRAFVEYLSHQGIFAKEVPCSNIAYHSRYIAEAGPGLLKYLKKVVNTPKLRSGKWVSTSVPQEKWDEPTAMYCSAEYMTNNLLSPVLFEETAVLIPSNAVLVEIAPHGLLQAILKRSLHDDCRNIALTKRGHPDNAQLVLEAIGQLYLEGFFPKVKELYPKVEFPVSTGTPMLSHQVEWAHSETWPLPLYSSAHKVMATSCKFIISIHDEEHKYLRGHVVRGKILYPFAAVLVSVWDTLAMTRNAPKRQTSVKFTDVHFHVQPVLHNQRQLKLSVSIHRGTGRFEVLDENSKVASGFITQESKRQHIISSNEAMDFSGEDIYKLMNMRDYSYSGNFKSIHSANIALSEALLEWNNNWVTLIDGIIQVNALRQAHDGVTQLHHIRSLYIDHSNQWDFTKGRDGKNLISACVSDVHDNTRCGGILMENVKFCNLPAMSNDKFTLRKLQFIAHFGSYLDVVTALHVYLQIVAENVNKNILNTVGIRTQATELRISKYIKDLDDIPGVVIKFDDMSLEDIQWKQDQLGSKVDLFLVENLSSSANLCQTLHRVLQHGTFVLNYSNAMEMKNSHPSELYHQVCSAGNVQLLRWRPMVTSCIGSTFTVRTDSDIAMLRTARNRLQSGSRMLIFAPYPSPPGLRDLVTLWRKEPTSNQINIILANANTTNNHYLDTDADLACKIWNNGVWGGEYYIPWQEKHEVYQRSLLQSSSIGDLRSLQWKLAPALSCTGVKVTIHYAGIHRGDILKATGAIIIKDDNSDGYGMDFSGVTENNERVMGIVLNGACRSHVLAQPELLWPVPEHWSLEDAATVPLAYMHAFYCLTHPCLGDKSAHSNSTINVLVHEGAGCLGQATISVALGLGCQVFATVSDIHKKRFLLKLFPHLKDEHIGNSRDTSFGDMILSVTKGVGCDIIISCVKENLKDISLKCCAFSGITLDTTIISHQENYTFGMTHLTKQRSFISVDFISMLRNNKLEEIKKLHRLVRDGIVSGYVRPLSRITYAPNDVVRAFRLLETSQHRGKVLLRLTDPVENVKPRFDCKPDSCNLLICDQGIIGLQLADRLISRGAKKLHLHYTNPPSYLPYKIRNWEDLGVKINVSSADLRNEKHVFDLIHNVMRLDCIEGIYVIAVSTDNEYNQKLLNHLDVLSRQLCPTLRYFAVISSHDNVGLHVCMSRAKDNYPSMKLTLDNLPMINNYNLVQGSATYVRGIIDVLESSVNTNNLIIAAKHLPECHIPLIKQIANVADVCIQEENSDSTLNEFGINNEKAERVSQFLRYTHNIAYDKGYVQSLTVQNVKDLEKVLTEYVYKDVKGLETFYSYVDPDELLATSEMVSLSTLTHSTTTRDEEFDANQTYLCIIPGLEGHYKRFCTLSERLKLHALVLQPGLDKPNETIKELADRYTQVLLKNLNFKKKFYLLGYEVGVLVALEIAENLERQGLKGTVFCLGNDPDEFKLILDEKLSELKTDEELQNAVILHMFKLMSDEEDDDTRTLEKVLTNISSWYEKIDVCVRTLLGRVAHSAQYIRNMIEAAFARIKQTKCYNAEVKPLRSKIILLRPTSCASLSSNSISARSYQPVAVHNLSVPLHYATEDLSSTALINKYLDEDTLEAFENTNLCDSYVINADAFMTIAINT